MRKNHLPGLIPAGQKHVENWLHDNHYFDISLKLIQPDDYGFIAKSKKESLLVLVRTFLHPQKPVLISDPECINLTGSATALGLVAYVAYTVVDEENNLVGEIYWDRLSKFY